MVGSARESPGPSCPARGGSGRLCAGASRLRPPGRRGGELLGQHRRPARRRPGDREQHHRQPGTDPHSYEPTASDARKLAGAELAIVNGIGYDRWASQLLAANPSSGRVVARRRRPARPRRRRQPAPVVLAELACAGSSPRSRPPTSKLDPADAAYFAAPAAPFETRSLSHATTRCSPAIRARFAGVAGRLQREHLRAARHDLGLRLLTPPGFAKAVAEGTEVSAADRADGRRARSPTAQIAVWVFNSQNVTPDVEQLNALARGRADPGRDGHRDPLPGIGYVPGMAGRAARASSHAALDRGGGAMSRRQIAISRRRGGRRLGGRTVWSERRPDDRGRASSSPCSGRTVPASRRCSGCCSACCRSRRVGAAVLGGAPGARTPRIGYLPQRHGFDSSTRIRGVDLVRLGLDGDRFGLPLPRRPRGARRRSTRRSSSSAPAATRARPIGELLGRRAAAAADRPGARQRSPSCCCSTSRSTASTCRTRPRSRRCSAASAGRAASPCCSSPTTSTRCSTTSTASSTSPAAASSRGPRPR